MTDLITLALSYLRYHWGRSLILILCLSVSIGVPWTVFSVIQSFEQEMRARGEATPIVIGAPGSRFDLTLHALTFETPSPGIIPYRLVRDPDLRQRGNPIPLLVSKTARDFPIVATDPGYLQQRGLKLAQGTRALRLGDAVVGAAVAEALRLKPGDRLLSDPARPFQLDPAQPLELRITGILELSQTPDDRAIFTDLRTGWILEGIGHGHDPVTEQPQALLSEEDAHAVASEALETFIRITPENLHTFHFHGDPDTFPLTAILLFPRDRREETLLLGHLQGDESIQVHRPAAVMRELISLMAHLERFIRWQQLFSLGVGALLIALIAVLSTRLRTREFETFHTLGCSTLTRLKLQLGEWVLLLLVAVLLAAVFTTLIGPLYEQWFRVFTGGTPL